MFGFAGRQSKEKEELIAEINIFFSYKYRIKGVQKCIKKDCNPVVTQDHSLFRTFQASIAAELQLIILRFIFNK